MEVVSEVEGVVTLIKYYEFFQVTSTDEPSMCSKKVNGSNSVSFHVGLPSKLSSKKFRTQLKAMSLSKEL